MYNIRSNRFINIYLIIILLLWNIVAINHGAFIHKILLSLLFLLLAVGPVLMFKFLFTINDDHFVYQVFIFNKALIKKEIYPHHINQLNFIEVGWFKKAAIIKVNKGMNIKLADIQPPKLYQELLDFACKHDIKIKKTKDYMRIERREAAKK